MNMPKRLALLALLLLNSCGTPTIYPQGSLATQIVKSRTAYPGMLTNQTCGQYDKQTCTKEIVIQYDLTAQATRDALREQGFVCKMGGHQYKICADQPGFCHTVNTCNFFTGIFGCTPTVTVIPLSPMPQITCFSPSVYDWDSIQ